MKKTLSIVWLVVFALSGCYTTPTSKSTHASIDATPTFLATKTAKVTIEPTPTKTWQFSNFLDRFTSMAVLPDHKVWAVSARGTVIQDYLEYSNLVNRYIDNLGSSLASVDFISSNDGWMTGSYGQIFHWDGKSWNSVVPLDIQSNISLGDIGFADSNNGWTVGCDYTEADPAKYKVVLLHWNGEHWENFPLLGPIGRENFCLRSIDVVSKTNVWVVGQEFYIKGVVLHWDGNSWSEIPSPEKMRYPHSISATGLNDIWISSSNSIQDEDIFHWDGQKWSKVELPVSFGVSYSTKTSSIIALSPDNVWVGGRALFHWDGFKWNDASYDGNNGNIVDIATSPDGKTWALTDTGIILQINR
jgi:photosystem II stability/assembly factor-like uncharacterized protein